MSSDAMTPNVTGPDNDALFSDAMAAIKDNRMDDAKEMLLQVVRVNPQHEQAWFWLAGVVTDVPQTIACIRRVLALNPDNEVAKEWLAVSLQAENEASAADVEKTEPEQPVPPIGAYLRSLGLVTEDQLNAAMLAQAAEGRGQRIGELLIAQGAITRQQLDIALHDQELDFFSLFVD